MTDKNEDVPEVEVKARRGFSIVWLIPLVALAIGGWLAYQTISERGPTITIIFETADGLERGKTKIKYKDVEVGLVEEVEISEDVSEIIVTAQMVPGTEPFLTTGTDFWVVRPRFGAGGVSGLGTLVSGAYIEMDPGEGDRTLEFVGLEIPPVVTSNVPGTEYLLRAKDRGSVSRGSPVFFRGIDVGEVLGYELAPDSREVFVHIFVRAPHHRLVRNESLFWNASGVEASVSADGVNVRTASFQAMMVGGIAFETPRVAMEGEQSPAGTVFALYSSYADIGEASITEEYPFFAYFTGSVRGLSVGAPVEFKGMRIGSVTDIKLELGPSPPEDRVQVTFVIEPERVTLTGDRPFENPYIGFEVLVEQGLRAQLQSGSLITGQLLLSLEYHADAPPAKIDKSAKYPVVPTVPTDLEKIAKSVSSVLERIAALPLEELIGDTRNMIQATERLINSPNIGQSLKSMRAATKAAETTLNQAQTTLASANSMIGENSQLRHDLSVMLKELADAARSIRVLTDYLERHPEALIQGKSGGAGR